MVGTPSSGNEDSNVAQIVAISLASSVSGVALLLILLRVAFKLSRSSTKGWYSIVVDVGEITDYVDELGFSGLYTDWHDVPLTRRCLEELRSNPKIRQRVPKVDEVASFAERKLNSLRGDDHLRPLVASLSDDGSWPSQPTRTTCSSPAASRATSTSS